MVIQQAVQHIVNNTTKDNIQFFIDNKLIAEDYKQRIVNIRTYSFTKPLEKKINDLELAKLIDEIEYKYNDNLKFPKCFINIHQNDSNNLILLMMGLCEEGKIDEVLRFINDSLICDKTWDRDLHESYYHSFR